MIRILITDGTGAVDVSTLARNDVNYIQLREPLLSTRELAALVRLNPTRILVNDRTDVAIACGAAGVHLRDGAISPRVIRKIAPANFIITVACHDAEAVRRAADEGADYAILAPIFAPLSKPATRKPLGVAALSDSAQIRIIALGGITEHNAQSCIEAGATGVAGITLFR